MKKILCTLALVLALSLAFSSVAFATTDDADLDEAAVVTEATDDAAVVEEEPAPAPVVTGTTITDAYTPADNVVTLTFSANIDGNLTADDITIVDANGEARNIDKIMFPAGGKKAVIVIRKIFDKGVTFTVNYNGMGTDFVR